MDGNIIAAIIGATALFATTVMTIYLRSGAPASPRLNSGESRRPKLIGEWIGTFRQEFGPDGVPIDGQCSITLNLSKKGVVGKAAFTMSYSGKQFHPEFLIEGAFCFERFLEARYKGSAMQFGKFLLELDPYGVILRGRFLGYGPVANTLVYGTMELQKRNPYVEYNRQELTP